jgi:hypothetical protein
MLFGADQSLEFCWLPSVPQDAVAASFSIGDETHQASGVGYHGHNWGNVALPDIIHDYYWARGEREDVYPDTTTGKPVAGVTRYTSADGDDCYIVTFTRRQDLTRDRMIDEIHGIKRLAATRAGFDGAYLPFTGECRVQVSRVRTLLEEHADEAIGELMYFGHAR